MIALGQRLVLITSIELEPSNDSAFVGPLQPEICWVAGGGQHANDT